MISAYKRRNQRGAILGFVVASAMILVILIIAFFQISMFIGGSRELKNSVDAGSLNTGKQALTLNTPLGGGDEMQFEDVADSNGNVSLVEINRVLAKALIIDINASEMKSSGHNSGSSDSHANSIHSASQEIASRLSNILNDPNNLYPFFDQLVSKNSVRMLGVNSTVKAEKVPAAWITSYMDRGVESNIKISQQQLPPGFTLASLNTVTTADKEQYIAGYNTINIPGFGNCDMSLVPFHHKEQPHLVSEKIFNQGSYPHNGSPKPDWPTNTIVPNAFSCQGNTQSQDFQAQHARSFVLTNPQKPVQLAIPHAFVRIKFEDNTCHWYMNGTPYPDSSYSFHPGDVQVREAAAGLGAMTVTAFLGNEYIPPTVWQGICASFTTNYDDIISRILQRINEIKSDFTKDDLQSLLSSQPLLSQDYIIFPDSNGNIKCLPKNVASGVAGSWIHTDNDPDGSEYTINSEYNFNMPNFAFAVFDGWGGAFALTDCQGSLKWTPGTGYDQCLGKLVIHRETNVYAQGGGIF